MSQIISNKRDILTFKLIYNKKGLQRNQNGVMCKYLSKKLSAILSDWIILIF